MLAVMVLVHFRASGAEYSVRGLEGVGSDGLLVIVEEYPGEKQTAKAIKKQVELRLLQSGIKIGGKSTRSALYVNPHGNSSGGKATGLFYLMVEVKRPVNFKHQEKEYETRAIVWDTGGYVGRDNIRKAIDVMMDMFLVDYLKANPKKKED